MNDVKYHKFTGGVPIIFVENFKDFPTAIGAKPEDLDEGAQFDDGNYCRTIGFKKSPLKFIVFEDAMMRTLFGHRRNDVVDATLAMYVAEQKYPMNPKLAMNHAIKLTIENNAVGAYQMLNSTYTRKFKSENPYHQIAIQEGLIEEAERTSADMKVSDEIERRKLKSVDGYGSLWSRSGKKPVEWKKVDGRLVSVSPDDPINQEDGEKSQQTVATTPDQPTKRPRVLKNIETGEIANNAKEAEEQSAAIKEPHVEISPGTQKAIAAAKANFASMEVQHDDGTVHTELMKIFDKIEGGEKLSKKDAQFFSQYIRPSDNGHSTYFAAGEPGNFAQYQGRKNIAGKKSAQWQQFNSALVDAGIPITSATTVKTKSGEVVQSIWAKKEMSPASVFSTDGETSKTMLNPTKTKRGFKIGDHEVKTIKMPDEKKLAAALLKQGVPKEELRDRVRDVTFAIQKNNLIVKQFQDVFDAEGGLPVIDVLPGVNPDTPEGRRKLQYSAIDTVQTTLANKVGKNNPIVKSFDELKTLKGDEFVKKQNEIIQEMRQDPNFAPMVADFVEIMSYAKNLAYDRIAYMPEAANFPLGDLMTFSSQIKTNSLSAIIESAQAILVSADNRSVKKDAGGRSNATKKVELGVFNNPETQEDLMGLIDMFDELFNNSNYEGAEKGVTEFCKKYGIDPDAILSKVVSGKTRQKQVDDLAKKTYKKHKKKGADYETIRKNLTLYMIMGHALTSVYNDDIQFQLFSDERYTANKSGSSIDFADGITRLTLLAFGFNTGTNGVTGAPGNTWATGHHHVDRTDVEAKQGNK